MSEDNIVFQYVAILHPTEKGEENGDKPALVFDDVRTVVATTDQQVLFQAARELPEDIDLDRVEVIVRPF